MVFPKGQYLVQSFLPFRSTPFVVGNAKIHLYEDDSVLHCNAPTLSQANQL